MIKAAGKHVLVKPVKLEEANPTYKRMKELGFATPDTREKDLEQRAVDVGVIINIGQGAWKDWFDGSPWAKIGDKVLFQKYGGYMYKEEGEDYILLNDEDVLAVFSTEE